MNRDIKDRWVAALRSGEYAQTTGSLERAAEEEQFIGKDMVDVGFCCLGVLCHLAVKDGIAERQQDEQFKTISYGTSHGDRSQASLPNVVQDWAGLEGQWNPRVPLKAVPENMRAAFLDCDTDDVRLAAINDRGATFAQIADIIEEYF